MSSLSGGICASVYFRNVLLFFDYVLLQPSNDRKNPCTVPPISNSFYFICFFFIIIITVHSIGETNLHFNTFFFFLLYVLRFTGAREHVVITSKPKSIESLRRSCSSFSSLLLVLDIRQPYVFFSSLFSAPSSPVHNRRLLTARNIRMSSVELPDDNDKSLSSASTSPCPSPVRYPQVQYITPVYI